MENCLQCILMGLPPVDDDHDGDVAEHHHCQRQDPGQARHKHRVEELLTKLEHINNPSCLF
jgi:hypothetical protein